MAGFFCWGDQRPTVKLLQGMLLTQTPRGTDSAGMAFLDDQKKVLVYKAKEKPEDFIKNTPAGYWDSLAASQMGLLHSRNITRGTNMHESNHPVHQWGWAVTHNGTIQNTDDLFHHYKEKRFADVDTAAVPLVLKQGTNYLDSLRHLTLLGGNATLAILSQEYPDRLALARFGRYDLYLIYDIAKKILYWSSLPEVLKVLPVLPIGNIAFSMISKMPEGKILVLYADKEFHTETYETARNPFTIPRSTGSAASSASKAGGTGVTKEVSGGEAPSCPYFFKSLAKCTHIRWNDPSKFAEMGIPEYVGLEHSLAVYDLISIKNWLANHRDVKELVVPTIYGRWFFTPTDKIGEEDVPFSSAVVREFRPKKSQKKFIMRYGLGLKMPVGADNRNDDLLMFDTYNVSLPNTGCASHIDLGWACPWCGATRHVTKWRAFNLVCSFCGIKSREPAGAQ